MTVAGATSMIARLDFSSSHFRPSRVVLQCVWHPNVLVVRMWLKVAPSAAGKARGRMHQPDPAQLLGKQLMRKPSDSNFNPINDLKWPKYVVFLTDSESDGLIA